MGQLSTRCTSPISAGQKEVVLTKRSSLRPELRHTTVAVCQQLELAVLTPCHRWDTRLAAMEITVPGSGYCSTVDLRGCSHPRALQGDGQDTPFVGLGGLPGVDTLPLQFLQERNWKDSSDR
jgi:hypothetical protein